MEYLEGKGLLTNPPDDILHTKEIAVWENSSLLKEYIRSNKVDLFKMERLFPIYIILFIGAAVLRAFIAIKYWKIK